MENLSDIHKNDNQALPESSPQQSLVVLTIEDSASLEEVFTVDDYRTALRLLVGAALEGGDELSRRIKAGIDTVHAAEQGMGVPVPGGKDESGRPLLYTLIGVLFKTPDYLSLGVKKVDQITRVAASFTSLIMSPITHSRMLRPARRGYQGLVQRGESAIGSLEARGRSEASFSRALVRSQVSDETIEEILSYLVEKAKIKQLIAEQGLYVADDASTELRLRSAAVDNSLDRLVDQLLRRKKLNPPAGEPSSTI